MENDEFITIHLEDVTPFVAAENAKRVILRYLHDCGVECESGKDDNGEFLRYHRPPEELFYDFNMKFYEFVTSYKNKKK